MAIAALDIDLAKNVFALHGVDAAGMPILVRPTVPRGKLVELVASLPPSWSPWKPVPARIIGRASSHGTVASISWWTVTFKKEA